MNLKNICKLIITTLCIALSLTAGTTVQASDNTTSIAAAPAAELISSHSTNVSISSGTATVTGKATSKSGTKSTKIEVVLQKKSGSTWTNIKTWTASGTISTSVSKTCSVSRGSYRMKMTVSSSSGSTSEKKVYYSSTVTY